VAGGQRRGRWTGVPLEDRQADGATSCWQPGCNSSAPRPARGHRPRRVPADRPDRALLLRDFADRGEFIRAVYDDVCTRAMSALTAAATPREAVEKFVAMMVDDPIRGRVLLLAPAAEPILTRSGADWMPNFIGLLQQKLTTITDPVIQNMAATSLLGGLTALFTAYLDGRLTASRAQFIDFCVGMVFKHAAVAQV
jgi:hypothetical protein